ncbi:MAG: 4-(cytidine 5'-diphospho)-2-C-methyl-D-erythritol kinase [Candidatus Omnitrophica bacterium]|nr:4-(cytidine 5'-diphospho)-2-C-methyl-D-erythritol kinase [Candidatus Omnitrophota bacterium]
MRSVSLLSPAKLNLFLKVLNKRPDGFHNITTVFERIDLCDVIRLKLNTTGAIRIHCAHPHVPCGPRNLVYRAARMLREDFKVKDGVDIYLKKNIPVAAGLGGGSSNAATALKGLNRLWKLDLSLSRLLPYARRLGSDVSFFMYDCRWALGTGRGDSIKKLAISTKLWHVLVVPCLKLYSGEVYGGLGLREGRMKMLTKRSDNATIFIRRLRQADIAQIGYGLTNDLEDVVLRLSPGVGKLQQRLKSLNTQGVMVSGSGPCVFAIVGTWRQAEAVRAVLARRFRRTFVARTL